MWPELSIVYGKPRHPQSQGSVERANGDIKDMLVARMADNNSTDWATGIKFVQFSRNSAYHAGIKRSPYAAMFGVNARVGLTSTSLPQEIISSLQSEQDLVTLLQERETDTSNPETESTDQEHEPVSPHHPDLDQLQHSINSQRIAASESQKQQAERMVKRSRIELKAGEIGDNVALPIPLVDRRRGDPRNILGVTIDRCPVPNPKNRMRHIASCLLTRTPSQDTNASSWLKSRNYCGRNSSFLNELQAQMK
ncbi:SCAN domain-containing protein 3-like [Macrobrachium rosenbergii]|uniref:SCAN domain-containing protein 3-like n=1 Tax=Macrobrachium rosenbergii TaxID=79674 RepID=UPI0034D48592